MCKLLISTLFKKRVHKLNVCLLDKLRIGPQRSLFAFLQLVQVEMVPQMIPQMEGDVEDQTLPQIEKVEGEGGEEAEELGKFL